MVGCAVRRCQCARPGTEKETVQVEDLGMLGQVDKGTWESRDGVECEKAKQNNIDMKYEGGDIDRLRRVWHGGRTDVEYYYSRRREKRSSGTNQVGAVLAIAG